MVGAAGLPQIKPAETAALVVAVDIRLLQPLIQSVVLETLHQLHQVKAVTVEVEKAAVLLAQAVAVAHLPLEELLMALFLAAVEPVLHHQSLANL